jgi:hypothetical protein
LVDEDVCQPRSKDDKIMSSKSIGQLAGKPRTPLNELFSTTGTGWIDRVKHEYYPTLQAMVSRADVFFSCPDRTFNSFPFEFPQSLDDFGLINKLKSLYVDNYAEYASQWADSDQEVIKQQIRIQNTYQSNCPVDSLNSLYFMASDISGTDRVVYIGVAKNGLLMRFFNGPAIHAHNNNYIGDCRSYESKSHPQYTWRIKSAELRRRGVCRVYWTILCNEYLKSSEKSFIEYKLEIIKKASFAGIGKDPVNR